MDEDVSPLGRQGTVTVNSAGRILHIDPAGLSPLVFSYVASGPNKGRVQQIYQTNGNSVRVATLTYDSQGERHRRDLAAGARDPLSP